MEIRYVTDNDLTTICHWWDDRTPQSIQELIARANNLKERHRGAGYIAIRDGVACGFVLLTYWVQVAEISDLLVIPSYRGQGIGSWILNTLCETARNTGYTKVEIGVLASNTRARQLYERMGFVPVRTIQQRYTHGYEDIIYLLRASE